MKLVKSVVLMVASLVAVTLIAVVFAVAIPDYEVEISAKSGECKQVEYQGKKVLGGCALVAQGKIARYSKVNGY